MRKPWLALATLIALTLYTGWTMANAEQSLLAFGLQLISSRTPCRWSSILFDGGAGLPVDVARCPTPRAPGSEVLPYCLLTLLFVSIGPLLYLVVHGFRGRRP
jgi:hypothetical protein